MKLQAFEAKQKAQSKRTELINKFKNTEVIKEVIPVQHTPIEKEKAKMSEKKENLNIQTETSKPQHNPKVEEKVKKAEAVKEKPNANVKVNTVK